MLEVFWDIFWDRWIKLDSFNKKKRSPKLLCRYEANELGMNANKAQLMNLWPYSRFRLITPWSKQPNVHVCQDEETPHRNRNRNNGFFTVYSTNPRYNVSYQRQCPVQVSLPLQTQSPVTR